MGQEVDIDFLAKSMIEQQEKGAHNINLVTPVMLSLIHIQMCIRDRATPVEEVKTEEAPKAEEPAKEEVKEDATEETKKDE